MKKRKRLSYFYLHPAEKNRAAPQYSILTTDYAKPTDMEKNLEQCLLHFPIEKRIKKETKIKEEPKIQTIEKKEKKGSEDAKVPKKSLLLSNLIEEDEIDEKDDDILIYEKPTRNKRTRKPNKKTDYEYDENDSDDELIEGESLSDENVLMVQHPQNICGSPAKRVSVDPNTPINKEDPKTFDVKALNGLEFMGFLNQRLNKKCSGITAKNKSCKGSRVQGTRFCSSHQNQGKKTEK